MAVVDTISQKRGFAFVCIFTIPLSQNCLLSSESKEGKKQIYQVEMLRVDITSIFVFEELQFALHVVFQWRIN